MTSLPQLSEDQLEQLKGVIDEAQLENSGTVSFPHVAAGVAGLAAAGITAVLVARDVGARALGNYDPKNTDDMFKLLVEESRAGRVEDISLEKLVQLRQQMGI